MTPPACSTCNLQTAVSAPCSLALVTTWAGDLWGLRRELVPWLTYHAQLGVSRLYVLYEGGDANTLSVRRRCRALRVPLLTACRWHAQRPDEQGSPA